MALAGSAMSWDIELNNLFGGNDRGSGGGAAGGAAGGEEHVFSLNDEFLAAQRSLAAGLGDDAVTAAVAAAFPHSAAPGPPAVATNADATAPPAAADPAVAASDDAAARPPSRRGVRMNAAAAAPTAPAAAAAAAAATQDPHGLAADAMSAFAETLGHGALNSSDEWNPQPPLQIGGGAGGTLGHMARLAPEQWDCLVAGAYTRSLLSST